LRRSIKINDFCLKLNEYLQPALNELNIQKDFKLVKRSTRSLLEELNNISNQRNSEEVIESRATHVIDSAINLLNLIRENYTPAQAYELERRMINSIKGGDSGKFVRSIRKLRDNKETARGLRVLTGDINTDD
jgi:uncharacterized protein (UPF0305 family)